MPRGSTVICGDTVVPASALHALRSAWAERKLVLFLGAGVSAQHGLPDWNRLLLALLERRLSRARGLAGCTDAERRALASWLVTRMSADPVVLARSIKRDIRMREHRGDVDAADTRFLTEVRDVLYRDSGDPHLEARIGTTLHAIGDLLEASGPRRHVPRVVTFNYDDLIERELTRRGVRHHTVFGTGGPRTPGLRIIHAHGYLPRRGPIPAHDVVLSEDDYHRIMRDDGHWSSRSISTSLRGHHVLCIGLSLRDPNLRRLLDQTRVHGSIPPHWQIQPRMALSDTEGPIVAADLETRLRAQGAMPPGAPLDADALLARVAPVLRKAEGLHRETSEALGVKTLWLQRFADLPAVLEAVRSR